MHSFHPAVSTWFESAFDAPTPARYNNDPARLYEASGSAGKLIVFAVRVDTFETDSDTQIFCIGVHDPALLATLRRRLLAGRRQSGAQRNR